MSEQLRPITILLVEDNPADVRFTREALKQSRILNLLHVVTDGERAMDFLLRKEPFDCAPRPDLVLLDLNLPRKDGREVLEEIKTHSSLAQIPVVVLTTSDTPEDIVKSYDLGASCYVSKPINLDRFVDIVLRVPGFWLAIVRKESPVPDTCQPTDGE